MYQKKIKASNFLLTGVLLIIVGIIHCFYNTELFEVNMFLLAIISLWLGLSRTILLITNKEKSIKQKIGYGRVVVDFAIGFTLLFFPIFPQALIPILFGLYVLLNGVIQLIHYLCIRNNKVEKTKLVFFHEVVR